MSTSQGTPANTSSTGRSGPEIGGVELSRSGISEAASEAAESLADNARTVADGAADAAASKAQSYADAGKDGTENIVRSLGRAFDAGSRSLEEDGMPGTAGYARAAANGLKRAADEVNEFDSGGLTRQFETFVRERPVLTVGVLAMAGFALATALGKPRNRA